MGIFSSRAIVIDAVLVTMAMLVASVHTSERAELIATVAKAEEALGVAPAAPEWPERTVLAFVTPWNDNGYELAIEGARRRLLNTVAPVWYQMSSAGLLLGSHDVKRDWLRSLEKASDGKVSVTPRVIFESWSPQDWITAFKEPKNSSMKIVAALVNEAQKHGYDGFVLEIWLQAAVTLGLLNEETAHSQVRQELVKFIARLGNMLDFKGLKSLLAVPNPQIAPRQKELQDLKRLGKISSLCIMSYDYNTVGDGAPRPNAPLFWIMKAFQGDDPEKLPELLMGLNFYGYSYTESKTMTAVTARDYLATITNASEEDIRIEWLEDYSEHVTSVRKSESGVDSILFPSAKSIRTRVALAEEYGAGISIWELGQGFASFLDELALVKRKTVAGSERHEELRR